MADNYLEKHREEYEQRKKLWLLKRHHRIKPKGKRAEKPDDETL